MAEMQTSHSHYNFKSHRNRFLTLTYILQMMFYAAPLGLLGCRPAGAIMMSPRWGYPVNRAQRRVARFLTMLKIHGGVRLFIVFHSRLPFHLQSYMLISIFPAPALGEPLVQRNEELTTHASHATIAKKIYEFSFQQIKHNIESNIVLS